MGKKKRKGKVPKEPTIAKRFEKDLEQLRSARLTAFQNFVAEPGNPLYYSALIVPQVPPYNGGAFRVQIAFPVEYPFKPPAISFKTKIYHPNIDEKGRISFPMIFADNWKPTTTLEQVVQTLLATVHNPNLENAIRVDVSTEMRADYNKFMHRAQEMTRRYAEKRPDVK